jgi:pimeloyl-ACP methyl ester carboxylesterase
VRQPQIAPGRTLAWLLLASLLALPALSAARTACAAATFLVEFLSEGRLPLLSAFTPNPARAPLASGPVPIDLYHPLALRTPGALVLVHGLAPMGKDDPRLAEAARLLARAGFRVAVPTIPGLTRLRLRPEDAEPVVAAIRSLAGDGGSGRVSVLGVSVGAGPALLAAADSRVADRVGTVLSLGGYASAVELLRYFLTGAYGHERVSGRASPQPEAARLFLRENLDLLKNLEDRRTLHAWLSRPSPVAPVTLSPEGSAVLALVENRDPARVDGLVGKLPPGLQDLLGRLSPERAVPRLGARLLLVHGRGDPAVPFTESLRLAAAAAGRPGTRLAIVGVLAHVEAGEAQPGWGETLAELWRLWSLLLDFFVTG